MYISVDSLGNINSISQTQHDDSSIEINDSSEWAAILTPSNICHYKFINDAFEHHPQPNLYTLWNGSAWVASATLLKDARDDMWERVKVYRQDRQYLGVQVATASQGTHWIHSDETSRALHLGLISAAIFHILHVFLGVTLLPQFPANNYWKTMAVNGNGDPIFILLDWMIVLQIFAADVGMTSACYAAAEYHRVNIYSSSDPLSWNYKTGWPQVFGE